MSQIDVLLLHDHQVALEPGAGVDARLRQRDARAVGLLVELHEHEVPDLDVAIGLGDRAAVGTELRAEVPEDLRRRSARPGVAHAPEVVLAEALDPLGREAHPVAPDLLGLVVVLVHRDPEAIRVELQHARVELPRPRDRVGLEVVAEAEVAEHLEEREVAVRAADVVEVVVLAAGPDALLRPRPPACTGAVSSPVKYDLNGTMPATVKSSDLSTGMTLADGTCTWARSVKNSTKARRSSSAVVGRSGIAAPGYLPPLRTELPLKAASRARIASRPSLHGGPHVAAPAVDDVGGREPHRDAPHPAHHRPRRTRARAGSR